MRYWLFKSEPDAFSIDDLHARRSKGEHWDGVRNFQARNMMRDEVKVGDQVLFYHSNCKPPGIVGVAEVIKEAHPDFTSWDPDSKYYDPRSSKDKPLWFMVDIKFKEKFAEMVSLDELKQNPTLEDMLILRKGNRLSITPVTASQFKAILKMAS